MPKIAELRKINGAIWARVECELGSPIQLLSPQEIEANLNREMANRNTALEEAAKAAETSFGEGAPYTAGLIASAIRALKTP